jgi:NAD(P)-dependent dehydrogenase (short-subunit alcohol dehydrogenase family)
MLKQKNVVVTGANRGIGFAIAKTFAAHGAHVFACMRSLNPDVLQRLAPDGEPDRIKGVTLDLGEESSINLPSKKSLP